MSFRPRWPPSVEPHRRQGTAAVPDPYIPGPGRLLLIRLDGTWRPATLRCWRRHPSGWVAHVRYRTGEPIFSSLYATLLAADVRDADACEDCPAARRAFAQLAEVAPRLRADASRTRGEDVVVTARAAAGDRRVGCRRARRTATRWVSGAQSRRHRPPSYAA